MLAILNLNLNLNFNLNPLFPHFYLYFLTRLLVFEFALPGGLLRPFAAAAISRMPVDVGLVARCFFAQARVLLRIVLCRCGGLCSKFVIVLLG